MEVKLFKPYPKQREVLDQFLDSTHLFGVVSAPRGSGKTLMAINMQLYWLLKEEKKKGAWISPVYGQARSVFDTVVNASKDLIVSSNRMELIINFVNGSSLKFLSSDSPDSIRGFRFHYIVIDEAAFHKQSAIETVILPTLNPNGRKCLLISTPRGKNHFYDWYTKGITKETDTVSFKIPLTHCPYINQALVDQAKKTLPPDVFAQEYLAEFTDASSDVFQGIDKVAVIGVFDKSRRQDAFIGIDTGLSADMSVLTIMSPMGRVLWVEALNQDNLNNIAEKFMSIMGEFNIVGGFIETNGIGRGMYDAIGPKFRKVKEFNTTQDSKTEMVRKLLGDIEDLKVELPTIDLCPELHSEMAAYTYKLTANGKITFTHPSGMHDDYLDSLMLANYSRVKFLDRKPLVIRGIKPTFS